MNVPAGVWADPPTSNPSSSSSKFNKMPSDLMAMPRDPMAMPGIPAETEAMPSAYTSLRKTQGFCMAKGDTSLRKP